MKTWTKTDYPAEMKYLPSGVRRRAIKIANSLHKESMMREGSAIRTAINMARESSTKKEEKQDKGIRLELHKDRYVIPYRNHWAIRIESSAEVLEVFQTKTEAVKQARREAFLTGGAVTIYKKDGRVERRINYRSPATRSIKEKSKR